MTLAIITTCTEMAMAQAKSFTRGQQVVIKDNRDGNWYLGKFYEYAMGNYFVEISWTATTVEEIGTSKDNEVLTLDDAKKQNIAYKDKSAGKVTQAPKTDVPTPPTPTTPTPTPSNTTPTGTAGSGASQLKGGDLVFVKKNGAWERGQVRGKGSSAGKTIFHVQLTNGNVEVVDNLENIVSAADGLKAGYFKKNYPNMTLSGPTKPYGTTGVACGNFCVITYTGNFTPNDKASTVTGKPGTIWNGVLADAIIRVTNEARQNPMAVAQELDNNIMTYAYDWDMMTDVLDAISYLRKVKSVGPLKNSDVMSKVNSDYINWYRSSGTQPHYGPNNNMPWDRVNPYGSFTVGVGENMSGGVPANAVSPQLTSAEADRIAKQVVYGLIIDGGAANRPKRGHRTTIYDGQNITY
jgi:uncharacterized protein YkwD